jgi:hypothetical protein
MLNSLKINNKVKFGLLNSFFLIFIQYIRFMVGYDMTYIYLKYLKYLKFKN